MTDAELNGHIDTLKEACDWMNHEATEDLDLGGGKLLDFVTSASAVIAALESARRERDAAEAARMTAVRREYSIGDRVTSLAVELFGSDSFDEDDCEDGAIEAIRTETRRLNAERDTARAEAEQLRSERGTVVVDGLTYGEHMTRDLRAQLAQRDRDWDALVKLIATTVGTEEDRDCAENDELAEFDPWHALRTRAAEAEQLRSERDDWDSALQATCKAHLAARAEAEQLRAERDAAVQELRESHEYHKATCEKALANLKSAAESRDRLAAMFQRMSELCEQAEKDRDAVIEQIAAWLDCVSLYYSHNRNVGPFIAETAEAIRAGCHAQHMSDPPRRIEGQGHCGHGVTPCDVHHGSLAWRTTKGDAGK